MTAPASCRSQAEYIAYFDDAIAVLQTPGGLERATRELCEDSAADGISYLEIRWAPRLHLRRGLSLAAVIEAMLGGLEGAPVRARAIVCAMRQHSVEDNLDLARVAARYAGRGVVGWDLAGDEARYPASPQAPAFAAARAAGLHITCHAGEAGEPASVVEALDLRPERLAHGVIGARSAAIVERIRAEGVVLDLCPTANVKCRAVDSYGDHPLPRLVRAGVRCTISTDSRTVGETTLSREFEICRDEMGMTETELALCNETAHAARFDS